ncbi:MAG: SOS response-associated peptidase [Lachnospiraceae bacterium]
MCCQFYFDHDTMRDIRRIVDAVESGMDELRQGDIHPSDTAAVISGSVSGKGSLLHAGKMQWGFPGFDGKQLLINARAETAAEKRTFRDSVRHYRCVIPAKHFYEWDRNKTKVTFTWKESSCLYFAGLYIPCCGAESRINRMENCRENRKENKAFRFVILTTAANDSMKPVHDRMPLILQENQIRDWIFDDGVTGKILGQGSPVLDRYQEYEQLSLF